MTTSRNFRTFLTEYSYFCPRNWNWSQRLVKHSSEFWLVQMSNDLKINTILKRLMKESGETLISLSKSTGVPKSTISEWLSNRSPNPVQAVKVANALGVSLHYLLFGEDDAQEAFQKIMKEDFFKGTFEISIKRVKVRG